jgi:hypothetical protein
MQIGIYGLSLGEMAKPRLRSIETLEAPYEQSRDLVNSGLEGWTKQLGFGERLVVIAESAEPYVLATEKISTLPGQNIELIWTVDESVGI